MTPQNKELRSLRRRLRHCNYLNKGKDIVINEQNVEILELMKQLEQQQIMINSFTKLIKDDRTTREEIKEIVGTQQKGSNITTVKE